MKRSLEGITIEVIEQSHKQKSPCKRDANFIYDCHKILKATSG